MVIEVPHLMRIPVSIITALVLEIDIDAIFHVINILFDDTCNIKVLFIFGKVSFICLLLLDNKSLYLCFLQVRQESFKVLCNVHIKMFCLLSYLVDNLLDLLFCETLPLVRI